MLQLNTNNIYGELTSPSLYWPQQGTKLCLSFRYAFDPNDTIELRVYNGHQYPYHDTWTTSRPACRPGKCNMDIGRVSFTSSDDYRVQFRTYRLRGVPQQGRSVYIDDVEFVQSPCELYPPTAHPHYCYFTGPSNCTFQENTFCGWKREWDWEISWIFVNSTGRTMIHLENNKDKRQLESRLSCATKDNAACLMFRYAFDVSDTIELQVLIQKSSPQFPQTLWTSSSSVSLPGDNMDIGRVPITSTENYRVRFYARRHSGVPQQGRSVYIDDVEFVQSPCKLYPPTAHPDYCYPTGPSNCTFQDSTFCGWKLPWYDGWDFMNSTGRIMIHLENRNDVGLLESRRSCATKDNASCLCLGMHLMSTTLLNCKFTFRIHHRQNSRKYCGDRLGLYRCLETTWILAECQSLRLRTTA
jgi:hypothetical protein